MQRSASTIHVDFGESLQTNIYLHNLASMQPRTRRTSLVKFVRSPCTDPPGEAAASVGHTPGDSADLLPLPAVDPRRWGKIRTGRKGRVVL